MKKVARFDCEQFPLLIEVPLGKYKGQSGYLIYRDKNLRLRSTEYLIALGLASPCGIAVDKIDEVFCELEITHNSQKKIKILSMQQFFSCLSQLRKKIQALHNDELIIPNISIGKEYDKFTGLRFWTKPQLQELQRKLTNPGDGIVIIIDASMRRHIFVDGREIRPRGRSISALHYLILQQAASQTGFGSKSHEFKTYCQSIFKRERMPVTIFRTVICDLRHGLKQVELELTGLHKKASVLDQVYQLTSRSGLKLLELEIIRPKKSIL